MLKFFKKSAIRQNLDIKLNKYIQFFSKGFVLDVGAKDSPYLKLVSYKEYIRLDIDSKSKPDICCDLHNIK